VVFEFTKGKLDQVSYVVDAPANPETAFLTWRLALTKRYGAGEVYLNKKPVGRPGLVLDEALRKFWNQKDGQILVVYPPEGETNVGVGIDFRNGRPIVEADFAETPANSK
jgi:hypothetical protein